MNLKLNLLTFNCILVLNTFTLANCERYQMMYKKYVIEVVNFMQNQEGWQSMKHLIDNFDFAMERVTNTNYTAKLNAISYLLNSRYFEVLQYFYTLFGYVLELCSAELRLGNESHFNYCTVTLYDIVKDSSEMFGKLYDAMVFMSQVDLKNINARFVGTKMIVDEIKHFKEFTAFKMRNMPFGLIRSNSKEILNEYFDMKKFYDNLEETKMLERLIAKKISVTNRTMKNIPSHLQIIYSQDVLHDYKMTNFDVDVIKNELKTFYTQTISNDFEKCGFDELLDPQSPRVTPPSKKFHPNDEKFVYWNRLVRADVWKTVDHISINYDGKTIDISSLRGELPQTENFNIIRNNLSQIMRCRYAEILGKFDDIMLSFVKICANERMNHSAHMFVYCVIKLYGFLNKSVDMFENMSTAMETVRKMTCTSHMYYTFGSHEKCLQGCVDEQKYQARKYNSSLLVMDEICGGNVRLASEYLNDVSIYREVIKKQLNNLMKYNSTRCTYEKQTTEIDETLNYVCHTDHSENRLTMYHLIDPICAYSDTFIAEVIADDCQNPFLNN